MSERFQIGEIAILQNLVGKDWIYNGKEVVVTSPFGLHFCRDLSSGKHTLVRGYEVEFPDRSAYIVAPQFLRKKRPPPQFTGEQRIRELFNRTPVKQPEPELA